MRPLYLDTARLGQTSPSALRAQIDLARLTSEQPSSLYFDRFLAEGIQVAPEHWVACYPGLQHWQGVGELKTAVRRIATAPDTHEVALASRSSVLMRAAARLMFRVCRKVLVTDCSWPTYQTEIEDAAARSNRRVSRVAIRQPILRDQLPVDAVIQSIAERYDQDCCDGLFLPAVDNLGLRLPVRQIVRTIESIRKPRFVVIDGAQAIGHLPKCDYHDLCDVFLAGCHKWLRAYLPLGIAIYGRCRSREWIRHYLCSEKFVRSIDDPLMRFSQALEAGLDDRYCETVNVCPLFSCRAALADVTRPPGNQRDRWLVQRGNAECICELARRAGWKTHDLDPLMRTGIMLLDTPEDRGSRAPCGNLREIFGQHGIAVSTYANRRARLSMPQTPLREAELARISTALNRIAGTHQTFDATAISA